MLGAALALAALALVGCAGEPAPASSVEADAYARELFDLANAEREAAGVAPLEWSGCLEAEAAERVEPFVEDPDLVHDLLVATCHPGSKAGENLARSDKDAARIVDAWMGSAGHRANLLDPEFEISGIACLPAPGGVLACAQLFEGRATG